MLSINSYVYFSFVICLFVPFADFFQLSTLLFPVDVKEYFLKNELKTLTLCLLYTLIISPSRCIINSIYNMESFDFFQIYVFLYEFCFMLRKSFSTTRPFSFFFSLGELIFKMNPTYYIQQNIVSRILIFPPNNLIRTVESLFSKLASLQMSQWQALHSEMSFHWPPIWRETMFPINILRCSYTEGWNFEWIKSSLKSKLCQLGPPLPQTHSFFKTDVSG